MLALTCDQFAPPSCVTQTFPSSVPAQTVPAFTGDSASETIVQCGTFPFSLSGSLVLKSPLIAVQLSPRFTERNTFCAPVYKIFELCGEMTIGVFQLNRKPCSRGRMLTDRRVRTSTRDIEANCASVYKVFGSSGSGTQYIPSPPYRLFQSLLRTPPGSLDRLGPPQTPLSCAPQYTLYGVDMSAPMSYTCRIGRVFTKSTVSHAS